MSGFVALVLAAGAGRRFGGGKLTASWRGGALIDGAVDAALAAPVRETIVVEGADPEASEAAVARARRAGRTLGVVRAEDHADGLSASLKAGLAAAGDCEGVVVFLADMPLVPHDLAGRLIAAVRTGAPAAAPMRDGVRGHPAVLGAALFPDVRALTGDRGAGALLQGLGARLVLIETDDPGVVLDVDRPEDLPA